MASLQFSGAGVASVRRPLPSFEGLRLAPTTFRLSSSMGACSVGLDQRCFRGLVVKAATVVAPKVIEISFQSKIALSLLVSIDKNSLFDSDGLLKCY